MASWFVRHWTHDHPLGNENEETNRKIQEKLFNEGEIGIHYANTCAIYPNDHGYELYGEPGRHAIQRLVSLAEEGGYICAYYPAIRKTLIGKVESSSSDTVRCTKGLFFIKRLPLSSTEEVLGGQREMLHAMFPIKGTIVHWRRIGLFLQSMVDKQQIKGTINILPPPIQETICQEYLRSKFGLKYLLLPFGRNLEIVDATGLTDDGQRIFNQVSNEDDEKRLRIKAQNLQNYYEGKPAKRVFFCPETPQAKLVEGEFGQHMDFVFFGTVDKWLKSKHQTYHKALFSWLS